MAQKSAKLLAARNAAKLNQTHLITAVFHGVFIVCMFTFRRSLTFMPYLLLSTPALILEFWLDSIARPKYDAEGNLLKAGEDLEAKGLTEFFWDIIYWTYINLIIVLVIGNRGWWAYLAVPAYAIYAATSTARGVKNMFGGMAGGGAGAEAPPATQSKRQQKMEARGGQKVKYR